jgi:hypothetical protein
MQLMGNSRARAVYEANLPEDFKRPSVSIQKGVASYQLALKMASIRRGNM